MLERHLFVRLLRLKSPALILNKPSIFIRGCLSHYSTSPDRDRNFRFSQSSNHPGKLPISRNIDPLEGKKIRPALLKVLRIFLIALPIGFAVFLYKAFNSEYDLTVEESFMKNMPGYEQDMTNAPKYNETINKLRDKNKEEVKADKNS